MSFLLASLHLPLDQAGPAGLLVLAVEKGEVVDHREGHREGADPVLLAEAIDRAFDSAEASGSYDTSAASASGIEHVGTTRTSFLVSALTWLATGIMFLLFGKIMTCRAFICSTAANSSAVDGFDVCPPEITPCTPN